MDAICISNISHEHKKDASKYQGLAAYCGKPLLLLLPLIVITIFTFALSACGRGQAAIKLPDTEVLVAPPVQQDVPVHSEWVATLDGYVNAEIRPQVSGYSSSKTIKRVRSYAKIKFCSKSIRDPSKRHSTVPRATLPRQKRTEQKHDRCRPRYTAGCTEGCPKGKVG